MSCSISGKAIVVTLVSVVFCLLCSGCSGIVCLTPDEQSQPVTDRDVSFRVDRIEGTTDRVEISYAITNSGREMALIMPLNVDGLTNEARLLADDGDPIRLYETGPVNLDDTEAIMGRSKMLGIPPGQHILVTSHGLRDGRLAAGARALLAERRSLELEVPVAGGRAEYTYWRGRLIACPAK